MKIDITIILMNGGKVNDKEMKKVRSRLNNTETRRTLMQKRFTFIDVAQDRANRVVGLRACILNSAAPLSEACIL